ncbi:head-tail adaptor protein [Campylobacter volucris]|uniref:phage head completion protein n=1 Tax=Campylobacter volucris TaxID=1031542 RepID=UPI001059C236|nr:head-tail adaptor protein [Campylobacter volucris]TDJ85385.1 head-tail adaptor protein [Campylobacter volucris]
MNAKALRHRLKIYKKYQEQNEFKELDHDKEIFIKEVFASCKNLIIENKEQNNISSKLYQCEFVIRFLELDMSYFIVFKNEKYEILNIQDENDNRQFLKLKARKINENDYN